MYLVYGFKARRGVGENPKNSVYLIHRVFGTFRLRRPALNPHVCDIGRLFAREKRDTNRATCTRVEQLEARGAVCCSFLARARADGVGGGAPACTAQLRLAGEGGVRLAY